MEKQNSYEGTRVFYKNKMESGLFSEVVVINTPLRKYQWQVFILRGGEITYKLYRRSFKGAVKTAEKKLCITSVEKNK